MLKNNGLLIIILCIGIILIHNSSEAKDKKDIDLYYDNISPQCRSVLLTLEALNLEINFISTSLPETKELAEAFLKENPLVTLPVLRDGNFVLSESRTIIIYLVQEYGGEDGNPLYPKDPTIQAQVNEILFFDSGTWYPAFENQYNLYISDGIEKTKEGKDKMKEALNFLDNVLDKSTWTAGNLMTVADFSLVTSISTLQFFNFNLEEYVHINEWLSSCSLNMRGYGIANQLVFDVTRILLTRKTSDDLSGMDSR